MLHHTVAKAERVKSTDEGWLASCEGTGEVPELPHGTHTHPCGGVLAVLGECQARRGVGRHD